MKTSPRIQNNTGYSLFWSIDAEEERIECAGRLEILLGFFLVEEVPTRLNGSMSTANWKINYSISTTATGSICGRHWIHLQLSFISRILQSVKYLWSPFLLRTSENPKESSYESCDSWRFFAGSSRIWSSPTRLIKKPDPIKSILLQLAHWNNPIQLKWR